jgi:hypothetical protein
VDHLETLALGGQSANNKIMIAYSSKTGASVGESL